MSGPRVRLPAAGRRVSLSAGAPASAAGAVRTSSFFITVNTNYRPRSDAEANRLGQELTNGIRAAFANPVQRRAMVMRPGGGAIDYDADIRSWEVDYSPEIAPHTGYLHAHILVEIEHTAPTGIHLNRDGVLRSIRSHLHSPEIRRLPYINIRGFSTRADILRYMRKDQLPPDFGAFVATGEIARFPI